MNYLVTVYTYHPYKIELESRVEASNYGVAIRRGVVAFMKLDKIKGKKLEEVVAKARRM